MKWFKHDSDASSGPKLKKLILRHGVTGYGIYFHCLELITAEVSESKLTFELEHDSEIIADNLKIKGDAKKSGIEIVEEIMLTIIDLGLFNEKESRIFCLKLLKRLDSSMVSSPSFRAKIKESHDKVMITSCKTRQDKTRQDKTKDTAKPEKQKKNTFHDCVKLTKEEYEKLVDSFGINNTESKIQSLNDYIMSTGKRYKSHYHTILSWSRKDGKITVSIPKETEEERQSKKVGISGRGLTEMHETIEGEVVEW